MRFSQDFLASLRERIPLSHIVGRFVSWDRRKSQPGKGDHWACCPFHEEKTPSFHVDDRKGFFHCFGCHAQGDHIGFLMDHQGLDFQEAVKQLAEIAGVPLPQSSAREDRRDRERRFGRSVLEAAAAHFAQFLSSPAGADARSYARGRGISAQTLRTFQLGLSPVAADELQKALVSEGFAPADLERAGLSVRTERGTHRARFRGRLMVPIHDHRGQMAGFGGRSLDGREPKYLNSPQTELFDKSKLLFNAHRARGAAHRANRLFVVEGYMDAIALQQAGVDTVVASLGTALTDEQIALAWQLTDEPVLCFDGDTAGLRAAAKALERIVPQLSAGKSYSFLALPEGQDPDDVVQTSGAEGFLALAENAVPLVDAAFNNALSAGAHTPERMAALETRLMALADTIADQRVRALYKRAFSEKLFSLRRHKHPAQGGSKPSAQLPTPAFRAPPAPEQALTDLERIVLGLIVLRPAFCDVFGERLATAQFVNPAHRRFASDVLAAYGNTLATSPRELIAALPAAAHPVLEAVWGAPDGGAPHALRRRFPILGAEPNDGFLERCVGLFLLRLAARDADAELARAAQEHQTAGGEHKVAAEARLMSLSAAVMAQRQTLEERQRDLADEAAALRREVRGMDDLSDQFGHAP